MAKNTEQENKGQKKPATKKGFWSKAADWAGVAAGVLVAVLTIPFSSNK